jgi:hypothetical protein
MDNYAALHPGPGGTPGWSLKIGFRAHSAIKKQNKNWLYCTAQGRFRRNRLCEAERRTGPVSHFAESTLMTTSCNAEILAKSLETDVQLC